MDIVEIAGRNIGPGCPCYIIAEVGVNHNGSLEQALRLVDVASAAGVDAVKFQTFRADRLVSKGAPKAAYQRKTTGSDELQYQMIKRLELSDDDLSVIKGYCEEKGLQFLSSPFDEESADYLESLGVPAFKIPSGEITNHALIKYIAQKHRPMIVSTGMCTMEEVAEVVEVSRSVGNDRLVLLHCVSNYPAEAADVNLNAMTTMEKRFGFAMGLSDHTTGIEIPLAAAALGATIIEKHFTLDRELPGPDHRASLEPDELKAMVNGIRKVEAAMGDGEKRPVGSEEEVARVARRSLVASRAISKGSSVTPDMIVLRRPGTGMPPKMAVSIIGKRANVDIAAGAVLMREMFE